MLPRKGMMMGVRAARPVADRSLQPGRTGTGALRKAELISRFPGGRADDSTQPQSQS